LLGPHCAGDGASVCRAPRGGVPLRPCGRPQWQASPCAPPAGTHAIGVRDRYLGQNHHPVIFRDDVNAKVALFDFKLLVLARRVFGGWGLSAWRSMPPFHPGPLPITCRFHLDATAAATLASRDRASWRRAGNHCLHPSLAPLFPCRPGVSSRPPGYLCLVGYLCLGSA